MTERKQCGFCSHPIRADDARFEVHGNAATVGVFCSEFCWEAAATQKAVHAAAKSLHADAECVLSDEGKLLIRG